MKKLSKSVTINITLLIIGLAGIILYFPCKFESEQTCLFEHFNRTTEPVTEVNRSSDYAHEMARHYVFPFGVIWWLSIAILWLSVADLIAINKNRNKNL